MSLRLATFNLESLGHEGPEGLSLEARIAVLRPMLLRLRADVLCLQEVNATRRRKDAPRELPALDALLAETPYAGWTRVSTVLPGGSGPLDVHNLVIVARWQIKESRQLHHDLVRAPDYRQVTPEPAAAEPAAVTWDRPLLYARIGLDGGPDLHLVNLHLKAPLAVSIPGRKSGPFAWTSAPAWAEGFFLAGVKRSGQALEARLLIDQLFDAEPEALIAVLGDFNADLHEVPARIIMAAEDDTGSGALAGRALVALERSLPASRRFSVMHHGAPQMLDHVLVSRPLLAYYQAVEIHNEALEDELVGYHGIARSPDSFHAPLVATFALPEAGADSGG